MLGCSNCWCDDPSNDECCQICTLPFFVDFFLIKLAIIFSVHISVTSACGGSCGANGRCIVINEGTTCCDSECAAGCTAGTANDCRVSKNSRIIITLMILHCISCSAITIHQ